MKYGEIINPEDVPAMMRSGDLEFGQVIQFGYNDVNNVFTTGMFGGFDHTSGRPFLCLHDGWYESARFPLPHLLDGDPVLVRRFNLQDNEWMRVILKRITSNNLAEFYCNQGNAWTSNNHISTFSNWRLPTKKELKEAGIENWYDGRIELEDE